MQPIKDSPQFSSKGPKFGMNKAPKAKRGYHVGPVAKSALHMLQKGSHVLKPGHGMPVLAPKSKIMQVDAPPYSSSAGANGNSEVPPFRKPKAKAGASQYFGK